MRISDWSSDVCSSDLLKNWCHVTHSQRSVRLRVGAESDPPPSTTQSKNRHAPPPRRYRDFSHPRDYAMNNKGVNPALDESANHRTAAAPRESGRASCRERGLQYV